MPSNSISDSRLSLRERCALSRRAFARIESATFTGLRWNRSGARSESDSRLLSSLRRLGRQGILAFQAAEIEVGRPLLAFDDDPAVLHVVFDFLGLELARLQSGPSDFREYGVAAFQHHPVAGLVVGRYIAESLIFLGMNHHVLLRVEIVLLAALAVDALVQLHP